MSIRKSVVKDVLRRMKYLRGLHVYICSGCNRFCKVYGSKDGPISKCCDEYANRPVAKGINEVRFSEYMEVQRLTHGGWG